MQVLSHHRGGPTRVVFTSPQGPGSKRGLAHQTFDIRQEPPMIVFASSLRHARRPRRIPTVASVVRALGTVRVSDQPVTWPVRSTPLGHPYAATHPYGDHGSAGGARRSG